MAGEGTDGGTRLGLLVLAALVLPGLPALALFLHLSDFRGDLQRLADTAAIAGAAALARGQDPEAAALAPVRRLAPAVAAKAEWPPSAGTHARRRNSVRMILKADWRPPLLGRSRPMEARATAAALPIGEDGRAIVRVE